MFWKAEVIMKRKIGLMLFCIGFGLGLMILFPIRFYTSFLILGLMLVGYHMFRC